MLCVMDCLPSNCPGCGDELEFSTEDYFGGACLQCQCGVMLGYASTEDVLKAADAAGSDLRRQQGA